MFLPGKVECFSFILDMTELSLYSVPVSFLQDTIMMIKRLFPECRSQIFILNPPYVVTLSWYIVKNIISEQTNSLIKFITSKDLSLLHQAIPLTQLE